MEQKYTLKEFVDLFNGTDKETLEHLRKDEDYFNILWTNYCLFTRDHPAFEEARRIAGLPDNRMVDVVILPRCYYDL